MQQPWNHFIGGEFRAPASGQHLDECDPRSGQPSFLIARGNAEDVHAATQAAQNALAGWRATKPLDRGRILTSIGRSIRQQIDALADKLTRAQQTLNTAQAKAQAKQTEQWVNIGESVLSVFMGKSGRRAVSSATSKWNQANQAAASVEQTKETIAQLQAEKQQLEAELDEQVKAITARWEGAQSALTREELKPRRSDVDVQTVTLGWSPYWQIAYDDGGRERTTTLAAYALPEVG